MASTISAGTTSGTALNFASDTTGILQLQTNGTTAAVTVDASQNVGIGTTTPAAKLNVTGHFSNIGATFDKGATTQYGINYKNSSQTYTQYVDINNNGTNYWTLYDTTNAQIVTQYVPGASGSNAFYTAGTERMRIDSSGQLLVGLTTAAVGANIQASTSGASTNIFVRNTNSTAGYFFWGNANGADKLFCAQTGSLTNATGTYGTISDAKLKENIVDATPKLDKITQLQVRNFNFIGDDLSQIGFIAQEIEQVFPSLVEEHIGRDEEGNETGEVTKSVKTSILIPILVKALQELNAKVDAQAAEIKALKGVA